MHCFNAVCAWKVSETCEKVEILEKQQEKQLSTRFHDNRYPSKQENFEP